MGRRGLEKFRRPRRRLRPGSAWEGSRGCGGPTWALILDDDDRRRAARRRPAAGAVGAWAPASLGLGQGNAWVRRLQEVLVDAWVVRVWGLRDRRVELRVTAHGSGGGSARAPCARGGSGRFLKANKGGGLPYMPRLWSRYGAQHGKVRRRHGRVRPRRQWAAGGLVGAAWPWRARHVAPGEWEREAVRRTGGPWRTVRRAKAGLGVRYGGARAACVAPASRRRARRHALWRWERRPNFT
jgi:hypothetical protein